MPTFQVTITHNAKGLARIFAEIGRRHLPFVTAASLTEVARECRDEMVRRAPERFTVRSRRFLSTFRFTPADKRDWPSSFAEVGVLDRWVARHEEGGTVTPEKSRRWAIPRSIRRTRSGKIKRTERPRELIESKRAFERDGSILERRGRGRARTLRTAYNLRRQVRLNPRLKLRVTVEELAPRLFGEVWERRMVVELNRVRATR